MAEKPRGEMPKSPEQPELAVAQAIAAERERYIAEQGDLSERERTLIVKAMQHAEIVAVETIQEMVSDQDQGRAWHAIHWVRSHLENLRQTEFQIFK